MDLASPSAIGSTTPNTGAFTTLSFAPAVNTTGLISSSYSLTGSNAQSLISLSGTWNTTGTPTAIVLNVTDTASNANSRLLDLQTGGTTRARITKAGRLELASECVSTYFQADNSTALIGYSSIAFRAGSAKQIGWSNNTNAAFALDVELWRDAASVLALRTGTTSQSFRLYRTFTDASNYERLSLICTRTTRFAIAAENAGTGAARSLEISFYTSASDPTSTDITDGCFSVWKNSGTGTIKLWANDGGTMKSVALA